MNFYNLSYSLNAQDRGIYRLCGNDRVPACRPTRTVSRKCDNASRYGTPPIVLSTMFPWARWRIRYFSRDAPNRWVVARTTLYNLCRDGTDTTITRRRTSNARSSLCWIPRAVDTRTTTHLPCRVPSSVKRTPDRRRRRMGRAPCCSGSQIRATFRSRSAVT